MSDFVIVQGDQAVFLPVFGPATVVVRPGIMQGTGKTALSGKKICLQGDEGKLMVPGCAYITPQYSIPGVGVLKISALGGNQTSKKAKSGSKAIILKGSTFTAKFEVLTPAQQPVPAAPPVPDATPQYSGSGNFVTTNVKFKAS